MLVSRWQAPIVPDRDQIFKMYEMEGLIPQEETFAANVSVAEQRRPFDIVITVAKGVLHLNVNGNQLLLRSGDRIMIPSNTKYTFKTAATEGCTFIKADRSF